MAVTMPITCIVSSAFANSYMVFIAPSPLDVDIISLKDESQNI